ncbi:MAG: dihydroneopterin aldolase [Osedax symbiont Rs2]|nr:MAG: dihydroneopterin aldolase [Osedax symbiont Rs2]
MDIVYIRQLKIDTVIGIFDWEREIQQTVCLDVDMAVDIRSAAAGEDIDSTVSYKTVSDRLIDFVSASEFLLVETMAQEIAQLLRSEFNLPWVRLRVGKPAAIAAAADVGVLIERGERPQIANYNG